MSGLNKVIPMYVYRTQKALCKSYNFYPASFLRWKNGQVRSFGTSLSDKFKYNIPISLSKPQICKSSIRLFSDDTDPAAKNVQKALDDEEFRNILKDFSKDFGVNDDNAAVLKDIREKGEASSDEKPDSDPSTSAASNETLKVYHAIHKERFKEFDDKDSGIIYSYEDEQQTQDQDFFHIDQEYDSHVITHEVKRGATGVFDIEELIPILREERLFDISVVEIPKHFRYADHLVLATAKSLRHARAVTEFILKFYKMKKGPKDPFIRIEGEKLDNWKVMDMDNIVLHVFLEDVREIYDIESLWLLDREYDSGGNLEQDEVIDIMQDELDFMNCLKPEETIVTEQDTK